MDLNEKNEKYVASVSNHNRLKDKTSLKTEKTMDANLMPIDQFEKESPDLTIDTRKVPISDDEHEQTISQSEGKAINLSTQTNDCTDECCYTIATFISTIICFSL